MPNALQAPASAQAPNTASLGSMGTLLSRMGTKAVSPGGVNTGNTNKLSSKQIAPAAQQTVQPTSAPQSQKYQVRFQNGVHHVPFKHPDGTIKYVNAKGEVSS